jgi:hypothetical protein
MAPKIDNSATTRSSLKDNVYWNEDEMEGTEKGNEDI